MILFHRQFAAHYVEDADPPPDPPAAPVRGAPTLAAITDADFERGNPLAVHARVRRFHTKQKEKKEEEEETERRKKKKKKKEKEEKRMND